MRRLITLTGLVCVLLAATACAAGSSPPIASEPRASVASSGVPCGATPAPNAAPGPGCLPGGSTPASPSFTTGPGGSPIGDWTLVLTGGQPAGTYGGRDEMVCVTAAGAPTSVGFNPVGSPPIGHVAAGTDGTIDSILVSAGGLEAGGNYQASDNDQFASAEILEGPTVTNGILHMKVSGTEEIPNVETRTMLLEVTCPLFPPETDG